jgi:hypothetical protein
MHTEPAPDPRLAGLPGNNGQATSTTLDLIESLTNDGWTINEVAQAMDIEPRKVILARAAIRRANAVPPATGWRDRALCRDTPPEVFYPHNGDREGQWRAQAICCDCPVQPDCLEWALDINDRDAVLGAMTVNHRLAERARRRDQNGAA